MPEPAAQRAIQALQRQLLALDARTAGELVRAYLPVAESIERSVARLFAQMEGKQLSFAQVQRLQRYDALLRQVQREINRYVFTANSTITESQRAALGLAQSGTRGVVNAGLPLGIDLPLLAQVGIEWNVLPTSAFESLVGISGDGAPLSNLLSRYGSDARTRMIGTLREGVGLGFSPRKTAANIRRDTGIPLSDALRMSRTETNRAYREGTRMQYEANPEIVKGYKRIARRSPSTCFACIALDGTLYETNEPLDEHPNGRCNPAGVLTSGATPVAASKRLYVGEMVTIKTASGIELSFTPNHPILTGSGWVAGGLLHEGRYVVRSLGKQEAVTGINVDYQDIPTPIEEVFESFSMVTLPMPATAEHFHGDGEGSEVYIVGADGLLLDHIQAPRLYPLGQLSLSGANVAPGSFSGDGPIAQMFQGLFATPSSFLSNFDSFPLIFLGEGVAMQAISLGDGTAGHNCILESSNDSGPIYPEFPSQSGLRLPADIFFDEIISVERNPFHGDVYSLQTGEGWYIASNSITDSGGVVSSNCAMVPVTVSYADLGLDVQETRRELPTARDWFRDQPESVQLEMMGPAKFQGWRAGQFELEDMAKRVPNRTWGPSQVEKPARELVGG